jgi:hypothetical protein
MAVQNRSWRRRRAGSAASPSWMSLSPSRRWRSRPRRQHGSTGTAPAPWPRITDTNALCVLGMHGQIGDRYLADASPERRRDLLADGAVDLLEVITTITAATTSLAKMPEVNRMGALLVEVPLAATPHDGKGAPCCQRIATQPFLVQPVRTFLSHGWFFTRREGRRARSTPRR